MKKKKWKKKKRKEGGKIYILRANSFAVVLSPNRGGSVEKKERSSTESYNPGLVLMNKKVIF